MHDSTISLLNCLFTSTGVRFNRSRLKSMVEGYTSITMETLGNLLTQYRIPTLAVKISVDQLNEVPLPAIACCEREGTTEFVMIEKRLTDTLMMKVRSKFQAEFI